MAERTVGEILDGLGDDFEEFGLKIKRNEPVCSVIISADGVILIRTCRDPSDLPSLVEEASEDLVVAAEERRERLAAAREDLQRQLNPEEVPEEETWQPDEAEHVGALEQEIVALRRQVAAWKATAARYKNQR